MRRLSPIQTPPAPAAIPPILVWAELVPMTALVCGSTSVTLSSPRFATQTWSASAETSAGSTPVGTVSTRLFEAGSITASELASASWAASPPATIAATAAAISRPPPKVTRTPPRRRRREWRLRAKNSRSSSFSSRSWVRAQSRVDRQAPAAIEVGGVAVARGPLLCRLSQVTAQLAALDVLLQPAPEPWPFADQRLVGDLDHAVVAGEQAVLGEPREHGGAHGVAIGVELGDGDAPADRRFPLALADQAQEHPLGRLALWRGELLVRGLGEARDGAPDPARSLVSLESQPAVVSRLPELDQGGGEQRQPAGLGLDLGHEGIARSDSTRTPARRAGSSIAR